MKKAAFFKVSLMLWLCWAVPAVAGLADTIDRVRGSVVGIGTAQQHKRMASGKPAATYYGTGFVVGNGRLVVTNHHVIADIKTDDAKGLVLAVFSGGGDQVQGRPARVVATDPEHDLAILAIESALPAMKLAGGEWVREGSDIAFTGFPIGMVLGLYPVTHKGIVSARTPIVMPAASARQLTAAQIKRLRTPFHVYQLDAIAYPGNSGSPVYDINTGQVIGVINSVFVKGTKESALERPTGITYAIPVRYVHALLKSIR